MDQYQYKLEPYSGTTSRHQCPACGKPNQFSRYMDTNTLQVVAANVGRCNREINCGYHYPPAQYFKDNPLLPQSMKQSHGRPKKSRKPTPVCVARGQEQKPDHIPQSIFRNSLKDYSNNHFISYLLEVFGLEVCRQLIEQFFIGTSNHWPGATVFWQVDVSGSVRTGKIMLYDSQTGRRRRDGSKSCISWMHRKVNQQNFNLQQCLFGEHQVILGAENNVVAIVESEKTAIISSVYFPQFIWMATGGLSNLSPSHCQCLTGRKVIFFPDADGENKCYAKWEEKARLLESKIACQIIVSDLLTNEISLTSKRIGTDIADVVVGYDHRLFQLTNQELEEYEERAAIIEYHGGLTRAAAEQQALLPSSRMFQ